MISAVNPDERCAMLRDLTIAGLASLILASFVLVVALLKSADVEPPITPSIRAPNKTKVAADLVPATRAGATVPVESLRTEVSSSSARGQYAGLVLFRTQISSLLAAKCLTCHDSRRHEGGLDLSRRSAALAGGDSGQAIMPGKPRQSLLFQLVTAAEMPPGFNPLSSSEVAALKEWIELDAPYEGEPLIARPPAVAPDVAGMPGMQTNKWPFPILPLSTPLSKDQAKQRAEHYLKSFGNPRLKIGNVNETILSYEAQVVTTDDSLVNWIIVDKKTGQIRFLY